MLVAYRSEYLWKKPHKREYWRLITLMLSSGPNRFHKEFAHTKTICTIKTQSIMWSGCRVLLANKSIVHFTLRVAQDVTVAPSLQNQFYLILNATIKLWQRGTLWLDLDSLTENLGLTPQRSGMNLWETSSLSKTIKIQLNWWNFPTS